jgi:hypothetical protein
LRTKEEEEEEMKKLFYVDAVLQTLAFKGKFPQPL